MTPAPPIAPPPSPESPDPTPIGDALLEGYADPGGTVQNDLQLIQRLVMSLRTLVKTQDPGRMAVNEDLVEVLLGKNDYKIVFLSTDHPAINPAGQLIDRWNRPLFFHLESADRLDVRSAGPDGKLFTEDDCHLHADGAYMPREALSGPPSSTSSR